MGSGCSLGNGMLDSVCTPEDIDNKIRNYFQHTKHKKKRRNTRFLINTSDDEDNEENYDENNEENYDENNEENYDENNEDNLEETNENNICEYNNNFRYKNKCIKKYTNPLSKKYIHKKGFNLDPLTLDIVSNYKKINKKLNDKNCELRLTKLLLQGKHEECENLKNSINCIASNSIKH